MVESIPNLEAETFIFSLDLDLVKWMFHGSLQRELVFFFFEF